MIASNDLLARKPDVPFIEIDDELILMDAKTGNYRSLSATARAIWDALEEPKTFAHLCHKLVARYEVDYETCGNDVSEFLAQLEGQHLISISAAGA